MQIAKLFAGLGFQVDTTGLAKFKRALGQARGEITNISRGAKTATNQFRNLRRETDKLSSSMNRIRNAGGTRNVGGSYRQLAGDIHRANNALNQIATNRSRTTNAIGKINASVMAGVPHWNAYRRSIIQTRQSLANLNGDLNRLRANSRIDVRIRNTGGAGGHGGGGSGGMGGAGALGGALGLRAMMGSFLPALAVSSAGGALGFGAAKTVEAARDQTRMESMLLMTAKSAEEFGHTLNYVRTEAARLGLSSTELGKSFAQINMSAQGLDQGTKEKMFTGFSEFMMSMGTSADDQKGIFRAFNQMFSNNRILQEEINQLSERGIPATLVYDAAMKAYDTKNIQQIKKLQEDGKLDPKRVLPIMAEMVQTLAHDSGAYAKMMESSIVKQGKLYEQLRVTSKEIMDSGLDVYLGKVFGEMTKLVVELGNVVEGLKYVIGVIKDTNKWFNELSGSNTLLTAAVFFLMFRFKGLALGIRSATRILVRHQKVGKALVAFFTGAFGKSLARILLRFTLWGTAIWGVTKLLSYLGKELKKDKLGGWTVFDEMALKLDVVKAKFELVMARASLFWTHLKNFGDNPATAISGGTMGDNLKWTLGIGNQPNQGAIRAPVSNDPRNRIPSVILNREKPNTIQGILDNASRKQSGWNGLGTQNQPTNVTIKNYIDGKYDNSQVFSIMGTP